VHLPVLDDLDDLVFDGLPDAVGLLRLPLERELGDRNRRLADATGRTPIRDHLERLLVEDLREVGEEVELIRELGVPGQHPGHPAMIRRCRERSCAFPRTTSGRTWNR